jgi:glycosyltransferase involved in cell wall biosynthesis
VPRVTVAICTRNRSRWLERAARSVLAQAGDESEILIVDNGSTDDTAAIAKHLTAVAPRVKYLREDRPGLSAARNAALRHARGEYVIFLDDDAVAEPGWLAAYESFFLSPSASGVAVVGGPVSPEYELPPPRWLDPRADTLDLGNEPREVPARGAAWGCNIAYRRDAAVEVGLFSTRLGRSGGMLGAHEETELNLRLERAGHETWWLPNARIRHHIAAERLRFRWRLRHALQGGRSRAVVRLSTLSPSHRRTVWMLIRVLTVPFQAALKLLIALVAVPYRHGRVSARALIHAAETLGFGCGLVAELWGGRSAPGKSE